jgi:hypothetical protein
MATRGCVSWTRLLVNDEWRNDVFKCVDLPRVVQGSSLEMVIRCWWLSQMDNKRMAEEPQLGGRCRRPQLGACGGGASPYPLRGPGILSSARHG